MHGCVHSLRNPSFGEDLVKIRRITTEKSYGKAVYRIGEIWEAAPGTAEAHELTVLRNLIEEYEEIHYRPYPPDPIEAIKIRTKELNLSRKDLAFCIGSEDLVSDILDRKSPLTPPMIRRLSESLRISERALRTSYALNLPDGHRRKRFAG